MGALTGNGWRARRLAAAFRVTALDVDGGETGLGAIDDARVLRVAGDLEALPLRAASFDAVIAAATLHYALDVPAALAEAARVLRPGGALFLCELHPYRQLRGGQAHFEDDETNETVPVTAYRHSVSEYVNGGIDAGLTLRAVGEHVEESALEGSPPRLLSVPLRVQ